MATQKGKAWSWLFALWWEITRCVFPIIWVGFPCLGGTFWYLLVLLGTVWYLLILLRTCWYFSVLFGTLLLALCWESAGWVCPIMGEGFPCWCQWRLGVRGGYWWQIFWASSRHATPLLKSLVCSSYWETSVHKTETFWVQQEKTGRGYCFWYFCMKSSVQKKTSQLLVLFEIVWQEGIRGLDLPPPLNLCYIFGMCVPQ